MLRVMTSVSCAFFLSRFVYNLCMTSADIYRIKSGQSHLHGGVLSISLL